MSFSFSALFASAEHAFAAFLPVVKPAVDAARSLEPVVETLAPSTIPVINAIEKGVASVSAIAPTAVATAASMIAQGQKAYADLGPSIKSLEEALSGLFHMTTVGQTVIVTPKVTAATVPLSLLQEEPPTPPSAA